MKYFQIDMISLKENFYSKEFTFQRELFLKNYQGALKDQFHDFWFKFMRKFKINIPFFDWFKAYVEGKQIAILLDNM